MNDKCLDGGVVCLVGIVAEYFVLDFWLVVDDCLEVFDWLLMVVLKFLIGCWWLSWSFWLGRLFEECVQWWCCRLCGYRSRYLESLQNVCCGRHFSFRNGCCMAWFCVLSSAMVIYCESGSSHTCIKSVVWWWLRWLMSGWSVHHDRVSKNRTRSKMKATVWKQTYHWVMNSKQRWESQYNGSSNIQVNKNNKYICIV